MPNQPQLHDLIADLILQGRLVHAVFSRPVSRNSDVRRVDLRPVLIQGTLKYQQAERRGRQEFHENLEPTAAVERLQSLAGAVFRDIRLDSSDVQWSARFSRKGICQLQQRAVERPADAQPQSHDRPPSHLIPNGTPAPFLVATGLMSSAGRVKSGRHGKLRQINRYVEFIHNIADRLPADQTVRIVDFGAGKSYLTFATHYYLTEIQGRKVDITAVEQRSEIVETCRRLADELQLTGLKFKQCSISDFEHHEGQVHLAMSLHACDTATDDAIASAIRWNANVIMAVPCCHHELASTLPRNPTSPIHSHGILHERFCELATDAVRAELLESVGYDTTVMEFIDLEHTARNVLIRAIRGDHQPSEPRSPNDRQQQIAFSSGLRLPPLRLQRILEECGLLDSTDSEAALKSE